LVETYLFFTVSYNLLPAVACHIGLEHNWGFDEHNWGFDEHNWGFGTSN